MNVCLEKEINDSAIRLGLAESVDYVMKLLAFDIDGTILPPGEKIIPELLIAKLNTFVDQGDILLFNSGRSLVSLKELTKNIHQGNVFYGVCNGSALYSQSGELLYVNAVPAEFIEKLHEENPELEVFAHDVTNTIVYYKESENVTREQNNNKMRRCEIKAGDDLSSLQILKICLGAPKEILDELFIRFDREHYKLLRTEPTMLEFVSIESDKVKTMDTLVEKFKVNPEEAFAFGDGENDAKAIKKYIGSTFKNGVFKCKGNAKFISPYRDVLGVLDAFFHFHL